MRRTIDLNADLGEGCLHDWELLQVVTSASISCGAHAGDRESMRNALYWAQVLGVRVGAHPGFADRAHFGRREQHVSELEVEELILSQFLDLKALADDVGTPVLYLKPHGALYHQAQDDLDAASGAARAARELRLPILGRPGSLFLEIRAEDYGVRFVPEGFPDRRYRPSGQLVPRTEPDAILHDPAEMAEHIARLVAEQGVETLCIHGDDPDAVANARCVRGVLDRLGIGVRSFV